MRLYGFKENKFKYIEIANKLIVTVFLCTALYFSTNILIEETIKGNENPYSVESAFKNINTEDEQEFEKGINELIKVRKYQSNVDRFSDIIRKNKLTQNEYIVLYNAIKSEKNIDKNNVYKKINKIDLYYELYKNLEQEDIKKECRESIANEANEVNALLDNPEVCRLGLEEIEKLKDFIKIYNRNL